MLTYVSGRGWRGHVTCAAVPAEHARRLAPETRARASAWRDGLTRRPGLSRAADRARGAGSACVAGGGAARIHACAGARAQPPRCRTCAGARTRRRAARRRETRPAGRGTHRNQPSKSKMGQKIIMKKKEPRRGVPITNPASPRHGIVCLPSSCAAARPPHNKW